MISSQLTHQMARKQHPHTHLNVELVELRCPLAVITCIKHERLIFLSSSQPNVHAYHASNVTLYKFFGNIFLFREKKTIVLLRKLGRWSARVNGRWSPPSTCHLYDQLFHTRRYSMNLIFSSHLHVYVCEHLGRLFMLGSPLSDLAGCSSPRCLGVYPHSCVWYATLIGFKRAFDWFDWDDSNASCCASSCLVVNVADERERERWTIVKQGLLLMESHDVQHGCWRAEGVRFDDH